MSDVGRRWGWRGCVGARVGRRENVPALAEKAEEGIAFALRARGGLDRFQYSLRHGPAAAWALGNLGTGSKGLGALMGIVPV